MFASPGPKGVPPPPPPPPPLPPSTTTLRAPRSATTIIPDEVIVAYGDGHGFLFSSVFELVGDYLHANSYVLVGTATRVRLHGRTSRALRHEIMAIGAPFDLVLTDLGEGEITDRFLADCRQIVSCTIDAPNVTRIGSWFLSRCTSLHSLDTSGLTSVTHIGALFLDGCTSLLAPPTVDEILSRGRGAAADKAAGDKAAADKAAADKAGEKADKKAAADKAASDKAAADKIKAEAAAETEYKAALKKAADKKAADDKAAADKKAEQAATTEKTAIRPASVENPSATSGGPTADVGKGGAAYGAIGGGGGSSGPKIKKEDES